MYFFLGQVVFSIHFIFLLLIVLVPFLSMEIPILIIHVMACSLVLLHWSLNNDVCALTYLEQLCMGITREESFVHRVVSPIYRINVNHETSILSMLLIMLATISSYRLYIRKDAAVTLVKKCIKNNFDIKWL